MTAGGGIHSPIGSAALLLAWNCSVAVGHLLPPTLLDIMVAAVKQRGLEAGTKRVQLYIRVQSADAISNEEYLVAFLSSNLPREMRIFRCPGQMHGFTFLVSGTM